MSKNNKRKQDNSGKNPDKRKESFSFENIRRFITGLCSKINKKNLPLMVCIVIFIVSAIGFGNFYYVRWRDDKALAEQQQRMQEEMKQAELAEFAATYSVRKQLSGVKSLADSVFEEAKETAARKKEKEEAERKKQEAENAKPVILTEYKPLYEQNQDMVGWLKIEDTMIDYPVMQRLEDENYYLDKDFYEEHNINGCMILGNGSTAGVGKAENAYKGGTAPTTNLIIHGHTMKSGEMFGNLTMYKDKDYGMGHPVIKFDSLYEKREYELIAVFYSQVFYQDQDVFKYYKFFQADTQEEFDDWYKNIKKMSLYDTEVTAEFGDEFITLSTCSYHVQDGRFVVIGKRVK